MNKFYKKYGYFLLLFFLIISLFDMRFAIAAIICMAAPVLFAVIGKGAIGVEIIVQGETFMIIY